MGNNKKLRWVVDITSQCHHNFNIERQSFDNRINPNYGQPINDTQIEIYVDASVQANSQAGCGIYISDRQSDNQFWAYRQYLGHQSSVLLCETVAIYLASTWLINNPAIVSESTVAIYSDSQNSVKDMDRVIKNQEYDAASGRDEPQSYNTALKATVALLKEASIKSRVTLRWIKAHAGHRGNHIADYYANLGAQGIETPFNIFDRIQGNQQPQRRGPGV